MSGTTQTFTTHAAYFESIYADAAGDAARVPWADQRPHPALITWLNAVAPSLIRCGSRVCVVGCGLGDDARELMHRGYEVTAFDCAESAIRWARAIDPDHQDCYFKADLFELPSRWRHRFDLVVEINTIQSLTPDLHARALAAIADLVSPRGHLLVICRGAPDGQPPALEDGPPWALTEGQLQDHAGKAGLMKTGAITSFMDEETPPVLRTRGLFRRA